MQKQKIGKLVFLSALLGIVFGDFFVGDFIGNSQKEQISGLAESKPAVPLLPQKQTIPITQNVSRDQLEFQRLMDLFRDRQLSKLSMDEVLQKVADKFLGASYHAGLLDRGETEQLFISLTEFDCVLFVETVLAFSRNLRSPDPTYENFVQNIQEVRYADGKLDGYCSRLHYFSEWIRDNQKRNIVRDLTAELGGIPLKKTLNFMGNHWRKYSRMQNNEQNHQCILAMEQKLELAIQSEPLRYIPASKIRSIYPLLKAGDIIAVTTDLQGLDATHTGLVYLSPNGVGFIHASPSGKVKISADLQGYVERVDHAIGIMVARPN